MESLVAMKKVRKDTTDEAPAVPPGTSTGAPSDAPSVPDAGGAIEGGGAPPASTPVALTLEDGSRYAHEGRIEFAEAIVDPDTGSVTLRARFANPEGLLLPGMFVRATLTQASPGVNPGTGRAGARPGPARP